MTERNEYVLIDIGTGARRRVLLLDTEVIDDGWDSKGHREILVHRFADVETGEEIEPPQAWECYLASPRHSRGAGTQ